MRKIDFVKEQIIESRNFVKRLISELPTELWYDIPPNTDSNFAWQIGHLMISQNFHAITCITGRHKGVYNLIPITEYINIFYGMGALQRSIKKNTVSTGKLIEQFNTVNDICINNLTNLNDDILFQELEPIPFQHPIANTKYEALTWSFKHEMWHASEMEAIKATLEFPIIWKK